MIVRFALLSIFLSLGTGAVQAAAYEFDISGNSTPSYVYQDERGGMLYTVNEYDLAASSASGEVPALSIVAGDTISATVTMSDAVTMPASIAAPLLGVVLEGIHDDSTSVLVTQSLSFFLDGQLVATSLSTQVQGLDGGAIGADVYDLDHQSTSALTFDRISFTLHVDGIYDADDHVEDFALLDADIPVLFTSTFSPLSAVPEAPTGSLVLGGLALVCFASKRRF